MAFQSLEIKKTSTSSNTELFRRENRVAFRFTQVMYPTHDIPCNRSCQNELFYIFLSVNGRLISVPLNIYFLYYLTSKYCIDSYTQAFSNVFQELCEVCLWYSMKCDKRFDLFIINVCWNVPDILDQNFRFWTEQNTYEHNSQLLLYLYKRHLYFALCTRFFFFFFCPFWK